MKIRRATPNVFVTEDEIVQVDATLLETLRRAAPGAPLKRIRFNAHLAPTDLVQEMILAVARDSYIPPHKHPGKSESFHIMEGAVDVILFEDDGRIRDVLHLGDRHSGRPFYYRVSRAYFHAVVVQSEIALLHETTTGPFTKGDTILAPWAPATEGAAGDKYLAALRQTLDRL